MCRGRTGHLHAQFAHSQLSAINIQQQVGAQKVIFERVAPYKVSRYRNSAKFTINHKVKATGFQPVSFSLAASLGFDEQAICEDAAFPTRGA